MIRSRRGSAALGVVPLPVNVPQIRAWAPWLTKLKLNVPFWPPTTFSDVDTVTVSPAWNPLSARKLPPLPSESRAMWPLWLPVDDPTTLTLPIWLAGIPRKAIVVVGEL